LPKKNDEGRSDVFAAARAWVKINRVKRFKWNIEPAPVEKYLI